MLKIMPCLGRGRNVNVEFGWSDASASPRNVPPQINVPFSPHFSSLCLTGDSFFIVQFRNSVHGGGNYGALITALHNLSLFGWTSLKLL